MATHHRQPCLIALAALVDTPQQRASCRPARFPVGQDRKCQSRHANIACGAARRHGDRVTE
jgi:hypothetical protein